MPQSEPVQPSSQDATLIMSKMFESMLKPIEAAHAQQVAALNQQIVDKQSIIDLQADKIKSQADEIASLQKFIAELRSMPTSVNIEDVLKKYPSPSALPKTKNPLAHRYEHRNIYNSINRDNHRGETHQCFPKTIP